MSAYATPSSEFARHSAGESGSRFLSRGEVMTARGVDELLRMPVSTVYELARKGVLPANRLGRTWRFLRPRLEQMLAA
jgi:excisionase family DNA binding protein